jgi:flavin reductase (DIM6/NTAB) family NADH-FMN oxidoreductase RutF
MPNFKDLRIVDNFYQTSAFFPMPTLLVGTLSDDGSTSLGSYSLCFPYYVAGKDYYAMLLECRNSSNTAQNILKTGKCSLNFIPDARKYFKEAVRLGFPGETSKEKMKNCLFTLVDGLMKDDKRPKIVNESYQVFECTWDKSLDHAQNDMPGELDGYLPPYHDFNGITSKFGVHFILKIDKILMQDKFYDAIVNGVKAGTFPHVPVDYGYRDSTNFWYTQFRRPIAQKVPAAKEADVTGVIYAASRMDSTIKFEDAACAMLTKVPRVFLKTVLQGCIDYAKENSITLITADDMKRMNDKRAKEKRR